MNAILMIMSQTPVTEKDPRPLGPDGGSAKDPQDGLRPTGELPGTPRPPGTQQGSPRDVLGPHDGDDADGGDQSLPPTSPSSLTHPCINQHMGPPPLSSRALQRFI